MLYIKPKGYDDGKQFNVEIQITDEADYDERALYYWGRLYTEQLRVPKDYSNLRKTIGTHILNFGSNEFHFCRERNVRGKASNGFELKQIH